MRLSRSPRAPRSRKRDRRAAPVGGDLTVRLLSPSATRGRLTGLGLDLPCAIGRSGMRAPKREGDGASPAGRFALLHGYYRADRGLKPASRLPLRPIRPGDGWCDAPGDRNYNRPVRLPYPASTETMRRGDHLYDIVLVMDANVTRRVRGRGSAIFLHLARDGFRPTEGCVALRRGDMLRLLSKIRTGTRIVIGRHERPHQS
ncbi:L,D-transpeptidase family protein [Methylobrevis pamukkalensis]|uniref:L,D-transpeptidase catalytic domain n=1 Tax=Methylobrevis pamukkalensis TaxID=1439726 RepID=A0A1E3H716_9HYPH|nr:L,D-transpeptidase family protein [Methylobrevis pamukkalensis]ODN72112.1 L,D-transpeptidase catalytic domain [Methylobrevis pamukkalensis]